MYVYTHNLLCIELWSKKVNSLKVEMEAVSFSENLVDIYYLKWRHILEEETPLIPLS